MMFEESTLKSPDPGLKPLNTQKAPPSFAESGVRTEKSSSLDARLASIETLLASGRVKADVETRGKVDINIKTAPGVRATGISTSNGDVDLSLNVGTDSLSAV
jgi:PAB1-binding protein PBP1